MEELQPGIYRDGEKLFTLNGDPGYRHYGENLEEFDGKQYREWNPHRSKPAAAVKNGIELDLSKDEEVLYLGAASGTTVSHFSDILSSGFIIAVEFSADAARDLVNLAERRKNIAPVVADARKPENYSDYVESPDLIYQDISQSDQAEILLRNIERFGVEKAMIAIKAQSISSSEDSEKIFSKVKDELKQKMEILDETRLEPYEKDHLFLKLERF